MDSVRKAKSRLSQYPVFLSECSTQATTYAKCVCKDFNVDKDRCLKEFLELKKCFQKAAGKSKIRI